MTDDVRFWATTTIASVALILSLLSLYLQWRKTRPQLRVSLAVHPLALPLPSDEGVRPQNVPSVIIHIANPSDSAVHIRHVIFKGSDPRILDIPVMWS